MVSLTTPTFVGTLDWHVVSLFYTTLGLANGSLECA